MGGGRSRGRSGRGGPAAAGASGGGCRFVPACCRPSPDLWSWFHPAGALLRQAHHPAEAGQDDVGALFLCRVGNRKGDAGWGEDAGDQDLLPLEDARHGRPILSEPAHVLESRSEGWLEGFEPSTLRSTI